MPISVANYDGGSQTAPYKITNLTKKLFIKVDNMNIDENDTRVLLKMGSTIKYDFRLDNANDVQLIVDTSTNTSYITLKNLSLNVGQYTLVITNRSYNILPTGTIELTVIQGIYVSEMIDADSSGILTVETSNALIKGLGFDTLDSTNININILTSGGDVSISSGDITISGNTITLANFNTLNLEAITSYTLQIYNNGPAYTDVLDYKFVFCVFPLDALTSPVEINKKTKTFTATVDGLISQTVTEVRLKNGVSPIVTITSGFTQSGNTLIFNSEAIPFVNQHSLKSGYYRVGVHDASGSIGYFSLVIFSNVQETDIYNPLGFNTNIDTLSTITPLTETVTFTVLRSECNLFNKPVILSINNGYKQFKLDYTLNCFSSNYLSTNTSLTIIIDIQTIISNTTLNTGTILFSFLDENKINVVDYPIQLQPNFVNFIKDSSTNGLVGITSSEIIAYNDTNSPGTALWYTDSLKVVPSNNNHVEFGTDFSSSYIHDNEDVKVTTAFNDPFFIVNQVYDLLFKTQSNVVLSKVSFTLAPNFSITQVYGNLIPLDSSTNTNNDKLVYNQSTILYLVGTALDNYNLVLEIKDSQGEDVENVFSGGSQIPHNSNAISNSGKLITLELIMANTLNNLPPGTYTLKISTSDNGSYPNFVLYENTFTSYPACKSFILDQTLWETSVTNNVIPSSHYNQIRDATHDFIVTFDKNISMFPDTFEFKILQGSNVVTSMSNYTFIRNNNIVLNGITSGLDLGSYTLVMTDKDNNNLLLTIPFTVITNISITHIKNNVVPNSRITTGDSILLEGTNFMKFPVQIDIYNGSVVSIYNYSYDLINYSGQPMPYTGVIVQNDRIILNVEDITELQTLLGNYSVKMSYKDYTNIELVSNENFTVYKNFRVDNIVEYEKLGRVTSDTTIIKIQGTYLNNFTDGNTNNLEIKLSNYTGAEITLTPTSITSSIIEIPITPLTVGAYNIKFYDISVNPYYVLKQYTLFVHHPFCITEIVDKYTQSSITRDTFTVQVKGNLHAGLVNSDYFFNNYIIDVSITKILNDGSISVNQNDIHPIDPLDIEIVNINTINLNIRNLIKLLSVTANRYMVTFKDKLNSNFKLADFPITILQGFVIDKIYDKITYNKFDTLDTIHAITDKTDIIQIEGTGFTNTSISIKIINRSSNEIKTIDNSNFLINKIDQGTVTPASEGESIQNTQIILSNIRSLNLTPDSYKIVFTNNLGDFKSISITIYESINILRVKTDKLYPISIFSKERMNVFWIHGEGITENSVVRLYKNKNVLNDGYVTATPLSYFINSNRIEVDLNIPELFNDFYSRYFFIRIVDTVTGVKSKKLRLSILPYIKYYNFDSPFYNTDNKLTLKGIGFKYYNFMDNTLYNNIELVSRNYYDSTIDYASNFTVDNDSRTNTSLEYTMASYGGDVDLDNIVLVFLLKNPSLIQNFYVNGNDHPIYSVLSSNTFYHSLYRNYSSLTNVINNDNNVALSQYANDIYWSMKNYLDNNADVKENISKIIDSSMFLPQNVVDLINNVLFNTESGDDKIIDIIFRQLNNTFRYFIPSTKYFDPSVLNPMISLLIAVLDSNNIKLGKITLTNMAKEVLQRIYLGTYRKEPPKLFLAKPITIETVPIQYYTTETTDLFDYIFEQEVLSSHISPNIFRDSFSYKNSDNGVELYRDYDKKQSFINLFDDVLTNIQFRLVSDDGKFAKSNIRSPPGMIGDLFIYQLSSALLTIPTARAPFANETEIINSINNGKQIVGPPKTIGQQIADSLFGETEETGITNNLSLLFNELTRNSTRFEVEDMYVKHPFPVKNGDVFAFTTLITGLITTVSVASVSSKATIKQIFPQLCAPADSVTSPKMFPLTHEGTRFRYTSNNFRILLSND